MWRSRRAGFWTTSPRSWKRPGTSWDKAVKTTIYLNDMADFGAVNVIYEGYLGSSKPARTTVEVAGLPLGALVEVDVVALA